ncbi:hypothetical protein [Pyrofollis japonicus]|nr:hypothetical protein [Pyrofollis japonicus]
MLFLEGIVFRIAFRRGSLISLVAAVLRGDGLAGTGCASDEFPR